MITAGTIAWASCAPGFQPPGPHALVVVLSYANGNIGVAFVTHSSDLYRVGVRVTRADCPSAFRERGGPLTDEHGVLGLVDTHGDARVATATLVSADRIRIGTAEVVLTRIVKLPEAEWQALRKQIRAAQATQS